MILSDITTTSNSNENIPIDSVGMENVEIPVKINNKIQPATHNIFVNLIDPKAKGIHMSRIFLITKNTFEKEILSFPTLSKITKEFIDSQNNKSTKATIETSLKYIKRTPSLITKNMGWRYYPIKLIAEKENQKEQFTLSFQITYSSTCPCSAGLSRQKSQEKLLKKFENKNPSLEEIHNWLGTESAHPATPHSQRSHAYIDIVFNSLEEVLEIDSLIEITEDALKTPVQSVVKREDEQKFAELNSENLLFSEDAVRRIAKTLEKQNLRNFSIKVEHQESLHPHNAVATIRKKS